MDSEDSNQTVFNTISNFNSSEVETTDEFLDSEPSLTNFSQTPFQSVTPTTPGKNSTFASSLTDATYILSALSNNAPDVPSPITDDQLEHDLDDSFYSQATDS